MDVSIYTLRRVSAQKVFTKHFPRKSHVNPHIRKKKDFHANYNLFVID